MARGIRDFTNACFAQLLPQLPELGGRAFRKSIISQVSTMFDISESAAATHYGHTLSQYRINNPEAVVGLGRPEGKRGGRPVGSKNSTKAASADEPVTTADATTADATTADATTADADATTAEPVTAAANTGSHADALF